MSSVIYSLMRYVGRSLANIYRLLYTYFFMVVAPETCIFCREYLDEVPILCEQCGKKIQPVVSYTLTVTKTRSIVVYALSSYQDPIRTLILAKTYKNPIIAYKLGKLMAELPALQNNDFDLIIPVPLHWWRRAVRGYNQAEEMGIALQYKFRKKMVRALSRSRATEFQSTLSKEERALNVEHAFWVKNRYKKLIKNKKILLVDDLMTSGATLRSCAKALFKAGARDIVCVVASRVI